MAEATLTDTEAQILEAAHRVFLRRGTAGARTQEIADEAGVNKALLHYYFRTKERLAEAVFLRAAQTLFPRMFRVLTSDLPLRDKLHRVVEIELDTMSENPYLPGYLISEFQYRPDALRDLVNRAYPISEVQQAVTKQLQVQIDAEVEGERMRPTRAEDLIISLVSQIIFPHAAAAMLEVMLGFDEATRQAMQSRYREELADRIMRSFAL